jgi:hypothetical protein
MKYLKLEDWIEQGMPRSYKHNELRIIYNCVECNKEVTKLPSWVKSRNKDRLFCSLSCSTRNRNLVYGVEAQKPDWRERWIESSKKNGTLPIKEKNGNWIKDRNLVKFCRKNQFTYTQKIERALKEGYRTKKGLDNFYKKHSYTVDKLIAHIENQFKDGMTWENYGKWEVDHIIPVIHFLRRGILDYSVINALTNLQPLWKHENHVKWCKITIPRKEKINV